MFKHPFVLEKQQQSSTTTSHYSADAFCSAALMTSNSVDSNKSLASRIFILESTTRPVKMSGVMDVEEEEEKAFDYVELIANFMIPSRL